MADIKLKNHQGRVMVVIETGDVETTFNLHPAQAENLAVDLLEMAGRMRKKDKTSLFNESPLIKQHNPPMEWRMNDEGKYLLAIRIGPWRPVILVLDDPKVPRKKIPKHKMN